MTTVMEIEKAITNLPPDAFSELRNWFVEHDNELWDRQIEADAKAGKFDRFRAEIEADIAAGRVRPL